MDKPAKSSMLKKIQYKLHYFANEKYNIFFYYAQGHPVNLKQKFSFGYMRIFDESKMYHKQLFSTQVLNINFDWSHNYFNSIISFFPKFQINTRNDVEDKTLDFRIRGCYQDQQNALLLECPLEQSFGTDIQKQFWKEFQNYNNYKNEQISQYQQQSKQNIKIRQKKLQGIKKLQDKCQKEKELLLGKLSAILAQKVNKLRQFEEDYNIQFFEDKLKKLKDQQQKKGIPTTYQENMEFAATLFNASLNFREDTN